MPAAISPTMMAATTQSTTRQNGGHHRVLATKWLRCCQRSLSPCPARPATSSHGDPVTAAAATTTNAKATLLSTAMTFGRPSATGETDVDRGDHDEPERVDRRAVQPPVRRWRGRLQQADDDPPQHGRACCRPRHGSCLLAHG